MGLEVDDEDPDPLGDTEQRLATAGWSIKGLEGAVRNVRTHPVALAMLLYIVVWKLRCSMGGGRNG